MLVLPLPLARLLALARFVRVQHTGFVELVLAELKELDLVVLDGGGWEEREEEVFDEGRVGG